MERAYDDAKYGRFSGKPYIDMIIPTLVDPSMAPPGKHIMSCFVQYAPYDLTDAGRRGTTQARRVRRRGDRHDRGVRAGHPRHDPPPAGPDAARHRARPSGLTEGNIFQGELSLEQLFFNRPVPGWARFRTPVRDLWLCGSSTHPGGGIMGAPGRIAAMEC